MLERVADWPEFLRQETSATAQPHRPATRRRPIHHTPRTDDRTRPQTTEAWSARALEAQVDQPGLIIFYYVPGITPLKYLLRHSVRYLLRHSVEYLLRHSLKYRLRD
jgi:hypothetical protein